MIRKSASIDRVDVLEMQYRCSTIRKYLLSLIPKRPTRYWRVFAKPKRG